MTQEEKAKRYDEAIEKFKVILNSDMVKDGGIIFADNVRKIFPELRESQDDIMKKAILSALRGGIDTEKYLEKHGTNYAEVENWLEKQGEQKPLTQYNYVKFREGDIVQKITGDKDIVTIAEVDIEAEEYKLTNTGFIPFKYEHLWHIVEHKPVISNDAIREGIAHFGITQYQINWLKKYVDVEQNPTNKVEPKFHEGEWLCENEPNNYARFIQILETVNVQGKERYRISRDIHNDEDVVEFNFVEKYYHKFDIKDAKDGDIIYDGDNACIFRQKIKDDDAIWVNTYCGIHSDSDGTFSINDEEVYWCLASDCAPATKEQRDLLFQKMKEAGYEWDADEKELKKIEHDPHDPVNYLKWDELTWEDINTLEDLINNVHYEFRNGIGEESFGKEVLERFREIKGDEYMDSCEQKPAWSEEDEYCRNQLIIFCENCMVQDSNAKKCANWLKLIKDRVQDYR